MQGIIKDFLYIGIGGVIAFAVIYAVQTAIITGTDTGSMLLKALLTLVVAAGIIWLIVKAAFRD